MLGNLGIIGEVMVNDHDRKKSGNALYGAFGQDFETADGRRVIVIALTDRQWHGLVKATGLGAETTAVGERLGLDLALEGNRYRARKELAEVFAPWFRTRRVEDFAELFNSSGITWSEFRSFREAIETDPDISTGHPMFEMVEQPGIGSYLMPGSPLAFLGADTVPPRPAPVLGEHTEAILSGVLGLDDHNITKLYENGTVAGPRG